MKAKLWLLCFVLAGSASASDLPDARYNFNSALLPSLSLYDSSHWHTLLTPKKDLPVIALGRSDFVLSGPLVQGFRRLPPQPNLTRAQRFLRLPLIRLFVPGSMESPPGAGKYFAWRNNECSVAWTQAASRSGIQKGPE